MTPSQEEFDRIAFLESLQNPKTILAFMSTVETLVINGEYSYYDSMTLFHYIFPTVKTPKGLRYRITVKYQDKDLAVRLYRLLISYPKVNRRFLEELDKIVYDYI